MNINDRSIVSAFLSIFSASVVGMVISVLFTPLLVRLLGAEQYGDYAFILSVLAMLMIFANAGVTRGIKKYLPEEDRPDSWQSDVFGFYTKVSFLLVGLICLPILLLSLVDFFGLVDEQLVFYFRLLAFIVLFKQLYWLTKNALQGMGYERYSEPIQILHRSSFAGLALGLAYLGYGVTGVLVGYMLSLLIGIVATTIYLKDIVDIRATARKHVSLPRKRLLRFNFLSVVLLFMMESLYNFDIILLRLMAGETQTGYYKAALVVAQLMWLLPKALQKLLLHSTSNYWSAEKYDKINTVGSLTARIILVSSCLMAAGLIVLADDFMPLYFGSEFTAAVVPILLLLPGVIGFAMARPINAIVQGSGELRVLIYATGGAAAINVVLNLVLIPLYGMVGAAVATSIGYGSMAVFSVFASRTIGFDPVDDLRLLRIGLAALVSIAVMYSIDQYIASRYVSLAIIPVIGSLVYFVAIFRVGAITEREAERVTEKLPNLMASRTDKILSLIT